MCRVSVIVPVYQVEAYLPGCLDSILAQTFEDFELILVDDGTKDDCPRIMAEYAAKDARIRQVHKANGGLSSARNAGLDIARGEYIAFVDSDDTVEPTMLADAVAAAERSGAQLVIYNYRLVTKDGPQGAYLPMRDETIIFIATGCRMCTGRRRGAACIGATSSSGITSAMRRTTRFLPRIRCFRRCI